MKPRRILDYDSLAFYNRDALTPILLREAYSGGDLAEWHEKIKGQVEDMAEKEKEQGNLAYAQRLQDFLLSWTAKPIDGSVNIEAVEYLELATRGAADYPWPLKKYFRILHGRMRKLLGKVGQELPTAPPPKAEQPGGAGGHGGLPGPGSQPPTAPPGQDVMAAGSQFGPEAEQAAQPKQPGEEEEEEPDREKLAKDIQSAVTGSSRPW